ncbi:MAG TPA: hypothetical protein VFH11_03325 [Gemmatimonadota bacterium]|nr:hypothetical protein [Gemmatimonadota bacterium]
MESWGRAALVLLIVAACASGGEGEGGAPPSDEVAAQAATIRWLIQNNDSALRSSATAYCVGSGSGLVVTEPPLALIRALRGTLPPVQPISRCAWARDFVTGRRVVDELSEAPALALFVDLPEWTGTDQARVWAEYLERPGLRGAYDCRLARGAPGWDVVECDRRLPR